MYNTLSYLYAVPMYRRLFALVLTIALLSISAGVHAQAPEWVVYNTENSELPSDNVIEVAFDPVGAMWIADAVERAGKIWWRGLDRVYHRQLYVAIEHNSDPAR